jgi:hypothetical protein
MNKVRRLLLAVQDYNKRGITYAGQRVKDQGRKPSVSSPHEYQILIDSMETRLGLVTSTHQINEYRDEEGVWRGKLSKVPLMRLMAVRVIHMM